MRSGAQGSAGAAAGASGRLLQSTLYHVPLEEVSPHNSGPLALPCRMRRGFGFGRAVGRGFGLIEFTSMFRVQKQRPGHSARLVPLLTQSWSPRQRASAAKHRAR